MIIVNSQASIKASIITEHLEDVFTDSIIGQLALHHFEKGERIIEESTDVVNLYLVLEGECRVTPSTDEGKLGFLAFILRMDVIGDIEYFSGDQYFHNVVALTPCTFLAIPTSLISTQFSYNINFYKFICENMANKMKRTSARYSSSLLYPLKNRLAKYLYDLHLQNKTDALQLKTTQTAEYFGVTPRHLRRVLTDLENDGLLVKVGSEVILKDIEKLHRYSALR